MEDTKVTDIIDINKGKFTHILKGIKIVNTEGKDIKRGFSFQDKEGKFARYKFKGNFDFSLGLIELERVCNEKGIELYQEIDGKLYSKVLMCVNFMYSNKSNGEEIKKVKNRKNDVRQQYKGRIDDTKLIEKDNANNIIASLRAERDALIKQTKDVDEKKEIRKLYKQKISDVRKDRDSSISEYKFLAKNELRNDIKELNGSLTRNSIRQELYENNFTVDSRIYRRYLRSSGSAREGRCIFILEDVYLEMMEYALAGNVVAEDMEIDLPSYEAYLGLTNTAIEDILTTLKPENILLVDDVKSKPYTEKCMVTSLVDGKLHTDIGDYEVSNSLFDGSSLIDFSLLDVKYARAGGIQLRNKWFKGFATGCNMQQFFENHGIIDVSQLNGNSIATDIKQIKFITTKSSIKYLKANPGNEGFLKWLKIISPLWGICGYPHHSKFVGGKYVQTHYQLLNNIGLSPKEVAEVARENIKYAELLKDDLEVFKMHINALIQNEEQNTVEDEENYFDEYASLNMNDTNKFMSAMLKIDDKFAQTKTFKDYRKEIVDNFIENCKRGHLLIFGCYATVIMNSIDYLYHAIDKTWEATKENSHMEHGSIMCDYFWKDYGKELLCSRSPMPVMGNILIAKNVNNPKIREYFSYNGKMSKYIMHINAIESNCCERGSGFDADGDKFLITNQRLLLKKSKENYHKFLVPVNSVKPKEEIKYKWNMKDKALLDVKCSQNNIGRIINDSMILVSEYWHRINNYGESHENLLPLYRYICELSIMSNLAIDACKRPVPYQELQELDRIEKCTYFREKETIQIKVKDTWTDRHGIEHYKKYRGYDGKKKQVYKRNENKEYTLTEKKAKVRPSFFKIVGEGQEYSFVDFACSMDYLQKAMKVKPCDRNPRINLSDLFSTKAINLKTGKAQKRDIDKMVGTDGIIERLGVKIKAIKENKKLKPREVSSEIESAKQEAVTELRKIRRGKGISEETLIAILKKLDKDYQNKSKNISHIGRHILSCLYSAYTSTFVEMFKQNTSEVQQLVEDKDGDIKVFNKRYKKVKVKFFEENKSGKPTEEMASGI